MDGYERRALTKRIPWVTWLAERHECDGFLARTALKHIYGTDEQRAARPRCKNPAHWQFRALERSLCHDGIYCMAHLVSRGLHGDADEETRTIRWLSANRSA